MESRHQRRVALAERDDGVAVDERETVAVALDQAGHRPGFTQRIRMTSAKTTRSASSSAGRSRRGRGLELLDLAGRPADRPTPRGQDERLQPRVERARDRGTWNALPAHRRHSLSRPAGDLDSRVLLTGQLLQRGDHSVGQRSVGTDARRRTSTPAAVRVMSSCRSGSSCTGSAQATADRCCPSTLRAGSARAPGGRTGRSDDATARADLDVGVPAIGPAGRRLLDELRRVQDGAHHGALLGEPRIGRVHGGAADGEHALVQPHGRGLRVPDGVAEDPAEIPRVVSGGAEPPGPTTTASRSSSPLTFQGRARPTRTRPPRRVRCSVSQPPGMSIPVHRNAGVVESTTGAGGRAVLFTITSVTSALERNSASSIGWPGVGRGGGGGGPGPTDSRTPGARDRRTAGTG